MLERRSPLKAAVNAIADYYRNAPPPGPQVFTPGENLVYWGR